MRGFVFLGLMWITAMWVIAHAIVIPAQRSYGAIFAPIVAALDGRP